MSANQTRANYYLLLQPMGEQIELSADMCSIILTKKFTQWIMCLNYSEQIYNTVVKWAYYK